MVFYIRQEIIMKHLIVTVLLVVSITNVDACIFKKQKCRIIQRQPRQFCQPTINNASIIVEQIETVEQIVEPLPGVIPVQPTSSKESTPKNESGPPAPSLELVRSSAEEDTGPVFTLVDKINFDLCTKKKINLADLEAVKAYQEETPGLDLSNLGKAKVAVVETKPAVVSNFALTDESPDEEYPSPTSDISGAEIEYNVGDLIELSVRPAEKPEGLISVDYTWTILPNVSSRIWPDKTKILFGTGSKNGIYTVILNTSYVFGERDPQGNIEKVIQKTAVTMTNVKVGNGIVETSPGGLSGLSRLAYEWTNDVAITENYNKSQLMADSGKLAESFKIIANEIQNGTLQDVGSILKRTKENNDSTIENRNEWLPWFTKMSEYLQTSYNNGTIKNTEDFSKAWLDISKGLEAATKG